MHTSQVPSIFQLKMHRQTCARPTRSDTVALARRKPPATQSRLSAAQPQQNRRAYAPHARNITFAPESCAPAETLSRLLVANLQKRCRASSKTRTTECYSGSFLGPRNTVRKCCILSFKQSPSQENGELHCRRAKSAAIALQDSSPTVSAALVLTLED